MPKTLDIQGFSGLREEVVRSEGRPSRSPVLQALISVFFANQSHTRSPESSDSGDFLIEVRSRLRHLSRSSQKATAAAAATFRESIPWDMGILTV